MIISVLSERAREFIEATPEEGNQPQRSTPTPTAHLFHQKHPAPAAADISPEPITRQPKHDNPSHPIHQHLLFHHDPFTMRFPVMYSQ